MDRVFTIGGIACVIGGFAVILYQGLTFLRSNVWKPLSLLNAVDFGPASLSGMAAASPDLAHMLNACPLWAALIAAGLILLWVAGRLRNRYA